MIRVSEIKDLGDGRKQCRVVIDKGTQTESGYVAAGEHYPFVVDPADPYGLSPIVSDMIAKGETER